MEEFVEIIWHYLIYPLFHLIKPNYTSPTTKSKGWVQIDSTVDGWFIVSRPYAFLTSKYICRNTHQIMIVTQIMIGAQLSQQIQSLLLKENETVIWRGKITNTTLMGMRRKHRDCQRKLQFFGLTTGWHKKETEIKII